MCDIDDFLLLISFQLFEIFREKKSILRLNSEELGGYEQSLKSNRIYNQRTFFFFEKLFSFKPNLMPHEKVAQTKSSNVNQVLSVQKL